MHLQLSQKRNKDKLNFGIFPKRFTFEVGLFDFQKKEIYTVRNFGFDQNVFNTTGPRFLPKNN